MEALLRNAWITVDGLGEKVRGFCTTRHHGVSAAPFDSLNLGDHVGDDPTHVQANRERLAQWLPAAPVWVRQVHGKTVLMADGASSSPPVEADAIVSTTPGQVLGILTADCMPVVIANDAGTVLGVAHAGWRGLASGVLQATLSAMVQKAGPIGAWRAWIGPCIGREAFEVGDDVREAFVALDPVLGDFFFKRAAPHKWSCDLAAIAKNRLLGLGATSVVFCGLCTAEDPGRRFFSYRRDGQTGRMATVAWLI